jgi:hypothetical protein
MCNKTERKSQKRGTYARGILMVFPLLPVLSVVALSLYVIVNKLPQAYFVLLSPTHNADVLVSISPQVQQDGKKAADEMYQIIFSESN